MIEKSDNGTDVLDLSRLPSDDRPDYGGKH